VKTPVDATLRRQARLFVFRFACDHCAHFDSTLERCSLAYPAAPRIRALDDAQIELCKTFELR
jgi:hypothetical protein